MLNRTSLPKPKTHKLLLLKLELTLKLGIPLLNCAEHVVEVLQLLKGGR